MKFTHASVFESPETKRQQNKELFRVVAQRYAEATQLLSFGRDRAWKRDLIEELRVRLDQALQLGEASAEGTYATTVQRESTIEILDLATGTGDLAFALAAGIPQAQVTGVDLSPEMIALAEQRRVKLVEHGAEIHSRIRFVEADMNDLPFADESFHVITAGYALRNAPELDPTLDELRRVTKPEALLAVLEFSRSAKPLLSVPSIALLRVWGALWGILLHQDPSVYAYIAESLRRYPDRKQCDTIFEQHGFSAPERSLRMFGLLELSFARKLMDS